MAVQRAGPSAGVRFHNHLCLEGSCLTILHVGLLGFVEIFDGFCLCDYCHYQIKVPPKGLKHPPLLYNKR